MKQTILDKFCWWKNSRLTEEEKNDLLVETCRRVFNTDDGKIVLNMLLDDLCFFKDALHDEHVKHLNHYAKFFIRRRLGVRDTKSVSDFIAETAASEGGKING